MLALVAVASAGCTHPLGYDPSRLMREQMLQTINSYADVLDVASDIKISRPESNIIAKMHPQRLADAKKKSGREANSKEKIKLDPDLLGDRRIRAYHMTLEQAIKQAIANNLPLRLARLVPAVTETQVTQAEAAFDAVFSANFNFTKLDTPQPPTIAGLGQFGSVQEDTREFQTGIRKLTDTGGQIQVATTFSRRRRVPSFFTVSTFYEANVGLAITQPLLRNAGSDVTRSQILLSRNARVESMADLKQQMLDTAARVEQAFWNVYLTMQQLKSRQRLLERSHKLLAILDVRRHHDVTEVEFYRATADVEQRETRRITADLDYRRACDELKRLINLPDLSVADEDVIVPVDVPVDLPISFNVRKALRTAFRQRPDLQRALLEIGDATIRQRVADNQRLPLLDLTAELRYNGVDTSDIGDSYDNMTDGNFIDYIIGLQFEQPFGNRLGEASMQQRTIEKRGAVIRYRALTMDAVQEIKNAIREAQAAYRIIGSSQSGRLASQLVVTALEKRRENEELTYTFVDQLLRQDEDLTNAEIVEFTARARYMVAIANFYRVIGTLLERNGIEFADGIVDETVN